MKFVVGSDHAGFRLKERIKSWLEERGHEVEDVGTADEASVDYPDFAHAAAERIARGEADRGVLVCGSGLGMSMAANRHTGIRAAVCRDGFEARLARAHNDANVLCLGQRVIGEGAALDALEAFVATPFEGGRHERRVAKIERR